MNQSLTTIQIIASRHCEILFGRFVGQSIVAICKQLGLFSISNRLPRNSSRKTLTCRFLAMTVLIKVVV